MKIESMGTRAIWERFEKEFGVIGVIQYEEPGTILFIIEPSKNQLEDISSWFILPRETNFDGDIPEALFKMCCAARMHPKNPCVRTLLSDDVRILYSDLRLSSDESVVDTVLIGGQALPDSTKAE